MPYKDELKKQLVEVLQQYFNEERGNRLTIFNMSGLDNAIFTVLKNNEIEEEKKDA